MNWEDLDTYFKKTRFHIDDEVFLKTDLKNTNLRSTIPYDDYNEKHFVPKRNLSKIEPNNRR